VVDVQCSALTALWEISGVGAPPGCLASGDPADADLDCNGTVTVVDSLLVIQLVLGMPFNESLDSNGNGCIDACEAPPG
jgi:hypothetical protein